MFSVERVVLAAVKVDTLFLVIAVDNAFKLCFIFVADAGRNKLERLRPGACIIKLITAVIYGFRNKL